MAETPQQLGLDLPSRPALGRDDFLVAPSNAVAVAMISDWHNWAGRKLTLTGPAGSGKTHLAHVWSAASGGTIVDARSLGDADIPALAQTAVAVEDVPEISQDAAAQTALFHLHNLVLAEGHFLLLTGSKPAPHWDLTLPDLASRVAAAQSATLDPPDDALLSAVLVKLFADRQLTPKADFISYLVKRMDRSFATARDLVAVLDAMSLAQKKPLTNALAAQALDKIAHDTP